MGCASSTEQSAEITTTTNTDSMGNKQSGGGSNSKSSSKSSNKQTSSSKKNGTPEGATVKKKPRNQNNGSNEEDNNENNEDRMSGSSSNKHHADAIEREKNIGIHNKVRQQRGKNVFAQPLDLTSEFIPPSYPKSSNDIKFIDESLADNFIFASLSGTERLSLINAMELVNISKDVEIIKQGDIGDYFYVVMDGTVSFIVDGNNVGSCSKGASFGELALLYDCPRAATCKSNTSCKLWKVDQLTFKHMLANNQNNQQKDINKTLRKVPFLSELEDTDLLKISDALTTVKFKKGETIICKGDVGEVFYILREGTAVISDIGFGDSQYIDQNLSAGDSFGERALLTGEPRAANVTASSDCTTLCLSRETFEKNLGKLQGLIDNAALKRVLMGVPIFANSKFEDYEMNKLTDLVIEQNFVSGTILINDGMPIANGGEPSLYIIRSGRINIAHSNGVINNLQPGDYFGDKNLKGTGSEKKVTISASEDTKCGVLSKSAIESVIGTIDRLGKPLPPVSNKLNKTIKLKDLIKARILGVGTFGKVWLVSHKKTGTPYALKMLNKKEIIGHHQVDGVIREKNIMSSIDHPFVVNLVSTFQDERSLYMLIDLVQGGELFSVIHTETRDGIPNTNSRFYAACILESLSHLHHRSICYRDLKPENILIDDKGYCVLVDLGFAKIVSDKTFTLCGTPEYLAPEIILSKGHDKGVDYWAFGVLIYEMLVGRSPFYSHGTDQVSLFKRIVQVKYSFPPGGIVNEMAQDLIQRLLVRRQANRFGCLARGDSDIRDHSWFDVINVDKLLKKNIPAPWVPRIRDSLDASHFDSYSHMEKDDERKQKGHGLSAQQQAIFKDF